VDVLGERDGRDPTPQCSGVESGRSQRVGALLRFRANGSHETPLEVRLGQSAGDQHANRQAKSSDRQRIPIDDAAHSCASSLRGLGRTIPKR